MKLAFLVGVALVGGAAVAIQAQLVGTLRQQMGALEAVFVTYASGGLVIALVMAINRGGRLGAASGLPWYTFATGLLGLVIIATYAIGVARLGLVAGIVAITVGQFVIGAVMAHYGWLGTGLQLLTLPRVAGLALLGVGTWLVIR